MSWQEHIIAAHLAVTDAVRHGRTMKSDRYFVWQEDGANDLTADDTHTEKAVTGTTDLFTKSLTHGKRSWRRLLTHPPILHGN